MSSLKDIPVLITGATGYIGSCLAKRLVTIGCKVSVLVRSLSKLTLIEPICEKIDIYQYDGTYESVENSIKLAKPQIVYHLASFASIQYKSSDINNMIHSNVLFGTFLAEAMVNCNVKYLINTSSYSQHVNQEQYNPNSLYAATKQAYEDILRFYSTRLNIINLVLFDNFGPNDPRPKIMNLLYKSLVEKSTLLMSPGEQYLDLLYIENVIDAYIVAAKHLITGRIKGFDRFSVSSEKHIRLKELVRLFEQIAKRTIDVRWDLDYRPGEIMVPWNKGRLLPDWQPKIPLEDGIRLLITKNQEKKT